MTLPPPRQPGDETLVLAVRSGQTDAFGSLAQRWFDRCWEVAWRILRDRDHAADVAQDALLKAWQQLDRLEQPAAFGGWVLRIARNRALDRLAKERRAVPTDDHDALERQAGPSPVAEPEPEFARGRHRDLVWAAAAALGERDASMLDLHLRHGLEPHELAEELGIAPNAAHQSLYRLRKRLGGAIRANLLWRDGRPECVTLRAELAAAGLDTFSAATVKAIDKHAKTCTECADERERVTAPAALFSAVPMVVPAPQLREDALELLSHSGVPAGNAGPATVQLPAVAGDQPDDAGGLGGEQLAAAASAGGRRGPFLWTGAVVLVIAALVGTYLLVRGPADPGLVGQPGPGPDATTEPAAPGEPTIGGPGPQEPGDPGPGKPTEPAILGMTAENEGIWEQNPPLECEPASSTVSAMVTHPAGVRSVELRWDLGGSAASEGMEPGEDDLWSGTLGPFDSGTLAAEESSAEITVTIVATGNNGGTAQDTRTVTLHDCVSAGPTISDLKADPTNVRGHGPGNICEPTTTTVSARIAHPTGIDTDSVRVRWPAGSVTASKRMERTHGDVWFAEVGHFSNATEDPHRVMLTVAATDNAGGTQQRRIVVTVDPWCPPAR